MAEHAPDFAASLAEAIASIELGIANLTKGDGCRYCCYCCTPWKRLHVDAAPGIHRDISGEPAGGSIEAWRQMRTARTTVGIRTLSNCVALRD